MSSLCVVIRLIDTIDITDRNSVRLTYACDTYPHIFTTYRKYACARLALRMYFENVKDEIAKEINYKNAQDIPPNADTFNRWFMKQVYRELLDERMRLLVELCERMHYGEPDALEIAKYNAQDLLAASRLAMLWIYHESSGIKTIINGIVERIGLHHSIEELEEIFAQDEQKPMEASAISVVQIQNAPVPLVQEAPIIPIAQDVPTCVENPAPEQDVAQHHITIEHHITVAQPTASADTQVRHRSMMSEQRAMQMREAAMRQQQRKIFAQRGEPIPPEFQPQRKHYTSEEERKTARKLKYKRYHAKRKQRAQAS